MAMTTRSVSALGWLTTFAAAVVIAQQVAGRATRDALFLANFGASYLPRVMLGAAVLSIAAALLTGRTMTRIGPGRFVPMLATVSAILFAVEWWFYPAMPRAVSVINYLHLTAAGAILVSGMWSIVNENFDPHTAKRWMGRIGAGATLGGCAGGMIAHSASIFVDAFMMLIVLALLNFVAAIATHVASDDKVVEPTDTQSGIIAIARSHYLQRLGALVLLLSMAGVLLDYALKSAADQYFATDVELLSFFAKFYAAVAVLTFVVQSGFAARALMRFGLVPTLSVLPLVALVGSIVAAAWTRFATVAIAKASEATIANSLFRSGYELLYTPLDKRAKRAAKTVIDVGCDKTGDGLGSLLIIAILWMSSQYADSAVLICAAVIATIALTVGLRLRHGYVEQLALGLRSGAVQLDEAEIIDATTRKTFADTVHALNRGEVLAGIEALRQKRDLVAPEDIRAVLTQGAPDPTMTAFIVPLLTDEEHGALAASVLRDMLPDNIGTLVDAMLSKTTNERAAARIAAILKHSDAPRAFRGLIDGLQSGRPTVRQGCLHAIRQYHERHSGHRVPEQPILQSIEAEANKSEPDLEFVFGLLGLLLDPDAMGLSLKALRHGDPALRGTALEYLSQVLPQNIARALLPNLGQPAPVDKKQDSRVLLQSMQSMIIDRDSFDPET